MTSNYNNDRAERPPLRPTLLVSLALAHGVSQICQSMDLSMFASLVSYVAALMLPVVVRHLFLWEEEMVHPSMRSSSHTVSRLPSA